MMIVRSADRCRMGILMNDLEKAQSCITQVTQQEPYLTGEKVIIAVLDSGIDYFLPEFRSATLN